MCNCKQYLLMSVFGFILSLPVSVLATASDQNELNEVSSYALEAKDLATYEYAVNSMSQFSVPILFQHEKAHQKLFVATFDCSWNNIIKGTTQSTNIGQIHQQISSLEPALVKRIGSGYVSSACAENIVFGALNKDAASPVFEEKLEEMYRIFITKSAAWLKDDPAVEIRLIAVGYSWSAGQAVAFTQLVHARGIQDPAGMNKKQTPAKTMQIEFTKPALVKSGVTPQAVGLFDPVEPVKTEVRLSASVVSGFQITAQYEKRDIYKSISFIKEGPSTDKRFLGVTVAGAHADIGGGYKANGLSIRSGNMMIDYLNALSSKPYLQKRAIPSAPAMNVIHRSEEERYPDAMLARIKAQSAMPSAPISDFKVKQALEAEQQGDYKAADSIWTALSEQGNFKAMVSVGLMHHQGKGMPVDYVKAMDWYLKAYQKSGDAMNNVGVLYRDGLGVKKNRKIAYLLFLYIHMEGMVGEETLVRANQNLRQEVAELSAAERHEALCYNLAYLVSYIESKGAHEKMQKHCENLRSKNVFVTWIGGHPVKSGSLRAPETPNYLKGSLRVLYKNSYY